VGGDDTMLGHVGELLRSDAFMPHGMCFLWQPELLWLHASADALIALSYYSIPLALLYFVVRRQDLVFPAVFLLFSCFILACGTTHVMAIWTLWNPDYWLDGGIKVFTALTSVLSAVFLWRIMPAALALPSRGELELANRRLASQITERTQAEEAIRRMNVELERRVADRTAKLEAINRDLRAAVRDKDVLLDEIRHRVKNNLQIVSGLLSLQSRNAPAALQRQLSETQERVRAMGRAHDQLYRSTEADRFAVDQLVRDVCADLGHLYAEAGQVTCTVDAPEPLGLPVEVAVPLALIVNEALANAYKHAFPEGRAGRIAVILRRGDGNTRIEVRDDGIGLAHHHAERGRQLVGMRLVKLLAAQISAQASWRSDDGTVFTLEVPDGPAAPG
jgi:two-component sensor histidine kinase